jgi:hypothetical protein
MTDQTKCTNEKLYDMAKDEYTSQVWMCEQLNKDIKKYEQYINENAVKIMYMESKQELLAHEMRCYWVYWHGEEKNPPPFPDPTKNADVPTK